MAPFSAPFSGDFSFYFVDLIADKNQRGKAPPPKVSDIPLKIKSNLFHCP